MSIRYTLIAALSLFGRAMSLLIFIRIIMSWFRPRTWSRETQWFFRAEELIFRLTEPILAPIRNILPTGGMGLDFSPIIAVFLLELVIKLVISLVLALPLP